MPHANNSGSPRWTLSRPALLGAVLGLSSGGLPAQGNAPPRPVQAFPVRAAPFEKRSTLQGEVLPLESMRLIPRVSGYVAKIHVAEGSDVKRDALLVTLDSPERERDLRIAAANVEKAAAMLAVSNSTVRSAEERVKVAKADLAAAKSERLVAETAAKMANVVFERVQELHKGRAVTDEELEEAQMAAETAAARFQAAASVERAAHARIAEASAMVDLRKAEVTRSAAALEIARAKAERAAIYADFARLKSPYSTARVTRQIVDAGTLAIADETAILEVMNVSKVRIRFGVPRLEAAAVRPGVAVRIVLPGAVRDDLLAKVTRITGSIVKGSRTMAAEVELDNADGQWLPGMLVLVDILLEKADAALLIPGRALVKEDSAVFVWLDDNGVARKSRVRTGRDVGKGMVRILSGIADGQRVIVSGMSGLEDDAKIAVTEVFR